MGKYQKTSMEEEFVAAHRRRRNWKSVVAVLGCLVVVGTVSALTLPAVTMSRPDCGLEEHQHSESCYGQTRVFACGAERLNLHQHTEACLDPEGDPVCGYADFVVHKHDETCYDAQDALVCSLPEIEEHQHDDSCYQLGEDTLVDAGHKHGDACYAWTTSETPVCGLEVSEGHTHGETCRSVTKTLTCTENEEAGHTHDASCLDAEGNQICELEEKPGHQHGDLCYTQQETLTCGQEESAGHQHDAPCFQVKGELLCQEAEREPVVQPAQPSLVCGKEERKLHTHAEACFAEEERTDEDGNTVLQTVLICPQLEIQAHQHTEECFAQEQTVICEKPVHTHDDSCIPETQPTETTQGETVPTEAQPVYYCNLEPHEHGEACADEEGNWICGLEAHAHSEACLVPHLTEEEQAQVAEVIARIDALPSQEEMLEQMDSFGENEEAQTAYLAELATTVQSIQELYNGLTEAQKAAVTNSETLKLMVEILSAVLPLSIFNPGGVIAGTDLTEGPDPLWVRYWVYLDNKWTNVGETHTGWTLDGGHPIKDYRYTDTYGPGNNTTDHYFTRDFVTVAQVTEILGPYGYSQPADMKATDERDTSHAIPDLAYHGLSWSGDGETKKLVDMSNGTVYFRDVYYGYVEDIGQVYPLTHSSDEVGVDKNGNDCHKTPAAYDVYYLPGATFPTDGSTVNYNTFAAMPTGQVVRVAYNTRLDWFWEKQGTKPVFSAPLNGSLTFDLPTAPEGWTVTYLGEKEEIPGMTKTPSADGTYTTYYIPSVTQTVFIQMDPYYGDDRSHRINIAESMTGDIETAGKESGITFKLFDYSTKINEYLKQQIPNINSGSDTDTTKNFFTFKGSGGEGLTANTAFDHDPFGAKHSTVKRNLNDNGYPDIDLTHHGTTNISDNADAQAVDGKSIGWLFGESGGSNEYVKVYNCENTPLQYNSALNQYQYFAYNTAADYNTENNRWYVRNYKEWTADSAQYRSLDNNSDFIPFNYSAGYAPYFTDAYGPHYFTDGLTETGTGEVGDELNNIADYWYGMTMETKFYMSKDGKVNGSDMIFGFSGDDDVYLFIDGVLVLDIGGTHGSCTGFVNFTTGLVCAYLNFNGRNEHDKWEPGKTNECYYTTVYDCYYEAYKERPEYQTNGQPDDAKIKAALDEIFIYVGDTIVEDMRNGTMKTHTMKSYRFRDYTSHAMKYFYMERGSAVANCNIRFNLPTLPNETLIVGKELEFENGSLTPEEIAFAKENLTYQFRVVDSEGKPISFVTNPEEPITVYDETLEKQIGTTKQNADGWFSLKAGRYVKFEHMLNYFPQPEKTYYVEEAIPSAYVGQYKDVVYKDRGTTGETKIDGEENKSLGKFIYKTDTLYAGESYIVVYTNKVDTTQMSHLVLEKVIQAGSVATGNETFPVVVSIGGTPVQAGTKFHYRDDNTEVQAGEGGVVSLQAGRPLQLSTPLLAGTPFSVSENDTEGWHLVKYETTIDNQTTEGSAGEMPVASDVTVTITNRSQAFAADVPVTKTFQGGNPTAERSATFHMEQVADKNGSDYTGTKYPSTIDDLTITCTGGDLGTGSFQLGYQADTPNGTYYYRITEESAKFGSEEDFIKDETAYVVAVTVENQTATVTGLYVNGVAQTGTTPAFVNLYATVRLPDTGGAGTTLYTFSGWAILLTTCALMYNSKRKQRKGAR